MKKKLLFLFATSFFSIPLFAQWIEQATGFTVASRGVNQIVITSHDNAWVTAYNGSVTGSTNIRDYSRTTDGGASWTAGTVTVAPANFNWSCLAAIDENTAWAMFYKATAAATGAIYKTTDGGTTWTQQGAGQIFATTNVSFPNVVYFWDANNGFAMGDPVNGEYEIYTTTNGGTSWTAVSGANIPDPTTGEYGLTASFAVRGELAWYGTNNGRVFYSSDKGYTWTVSSTGFEGYYVPKLDFASKELGWASLYLADAGGNITDRQFVRTTDGGASWTGLSQNAPYHYGGFSYVPNTDMTLVSVGVDFAAYDLGSSYSLDGGDTWEIIDEGIQYTDVNFYDNVTAWAGGFSVDQYTGGIFKYDGGFVATGISPNTVDYKMNLHPNPSNGLFYLSFDAENNLPINLQVTDAMGKVVLQKTYKDKSQLWLKSIDLRGYSPGVYFMQLENDGNETTQKLIVQ